jgi:hypothetical protein
LQFEVEVGEKARSTPAAPVHRNRVAFKVWQQFMQNPFAQNTYEPL